MKGLLMQNMAASTLFYLLLFGYFLPTLASQHLHNNHQYLHHRSNDTAGHTTQSAQDTVEKALKALRIANQLRVQNVQFNKYEFENSTANQTQSVIIPLLDYADPVKNASLSKLHRRQATNETEGMGANPKYGYILSPELIEAAKEVAESVPPSNWDLNYAEVAEGMRAKYGSRNNDTIAMTQSLVHTNGLSRYTEVDQPVSLQQPMQEARVKRAGSSYWMAKIEQNGASPYAPADYKVWRNVMDYGAKGDGVTDDTAAINRAISEGSRCGPGCHSSTRFPAVVWFPPGTYLVSSPIIQYYNTQFLGDPTNLPTILAASSFVGLGVITSDVYVGQTEEWYLNTNNFLRSIKNFKIDITRTDQSAYVCGIHWQVAQGTSLENIDFYMLQNVAGNTQQGIYMENGSGGFLADLTFVGGNFGAYFGNQQFTTSHLVFVNCKTALQIHWDWVWTMQDVVIESCGTGLVVTGGAGGPLSTGQSLGSLVLVDAIIANTPNGIVTSLYAENSTSLLLQNVGFFNVQNAVTDSVLSKVLLAGATRVTGANGANNFANGENIPVMNRTESLLSSQLAYVKPNFYTRRRPKYTDIGMSQIINIKTAGAKGDGVTDDTSALSSIFAAAANMSSIVFIPYGVYVVTDTVKIPIGSRIIGQAWPQIMGKGPKFSNPLEKRAVIQVGEPGESGVVEIQDLLFTVSGNTVGAVLVEWNIHEISQGSTGLWVFVANFLIILDSHFRVGGAVGSNLQAAQCPKGNGVNKNCIAAAALLHMTPKSSAYLENVWMWTADHDLDASDEVQIDIFSGRGALIESHGPTWLYGTAAEHNVLYQYQISSASNILMGMIQTEAPYFQPHPKAPLPIVTGIFPNDPMFTDCATDSKTCAVSWAVRIVNSSTVYLLGAGLYSWFSDYSQDCLTTENCQDKGFDIQESHDLWIYNLITKAIVEMISPVNEIATLAKNNKNGFMSSIMAWLKGSEQTTGQKTFPGFTIYSPDDLPSTFSAECITALSATIDCDLYVFDFYETAYHGSLGNETLTDSVCDKGCGESLGNWVHDVQRNCAGYTLFSNPADRFGGNMWAGWNETCYKDPTTNLYCNDIIQNFTRVATVDDMSHDELCSYCYKTKLQLMQSSQYSYYNEIFKHSLETVVSKCGIAANTTIPSSLTIIEPAEEPICISENIYTTKDGDTCTSIALDYSLSSAALYMGNQNLIHDCQKVAKGAKLCLPLSCEHTYILQDQDTCRSIERANAVVLYNNSRAIKSVLRQFNPWIDTHCTNLHETSQAYGSVLCLSPQYGYFNTTDPVHTSRNPFAVGQSDGYGAYPIDPPLNYTVAPGTTLRCGKWHVASESESCAQICIQDEITNKLFLDVNPSLSFENCTQGLVSGYAYCTGPMRGWNYTAT
ncbi:pectate lyase superfamily protein-domain-containing protein [Talaromyces proteolyticus]|uniref:Pectate lyase superfamily protein-domain-containing protein n=1 Tax=Talaromyces proteolyticus TaxID=1131652 RepID=A0AAD4KWF5_9EURO|nr:pectate lyase superfamily protein-domain-containing protein [Talaromyces proteolyticus]KAH8698403.1 pectate lyase superfamily protein-domain-containing protein [Talaromyces proteolyticus]